MKRFKDVSNVAMETKRVKRLIELSNNDINDVVKIVRTSDSNYGERNNRDKNYNYKMIGCDVIPQVGNFYIWAVIKQKEF